MKSADALLPLPIPRYKDVRAPARILLLLLFLVRGFGSAAADLDKAREQYLSGTLGKEGRGGSRLGVARHFALSLVGRARHQARKLFGG